MKGIATIAVLLSLCGAVNAQKPDSYLDVASRQFTGSVLNELMASALGDGILIMRRSYELVDTTNGDRYGWNGAKEFSVVMSLGVSTDRGIVATGKFVSPWDSDPNFKPFSGQQYKPSPLDATLRPMHQNEEESIDLEVDADRRINTIGEKLYLIASYRPGFALDTTSGLKEGLLVVVSVSTDANGTLKEDYQYSFSRAKLTVNADTSVYDVAQPRLQGRTVIGGLLITPEIALGAINFKVVALMQQLGERWVLTCPDVNPELQKENTPTPNPKLTRKYDRRRRERRIRRNTTTNSISLTQTKN